MQKINYILIVVSIDISFDIMSFLDKQKMVDRISVDSQQNSSLVRQRQQTIKQLTNSLSKCQNQINQKNKQLEQISQIKNNIQKLPYSIYKEFVISTEKDGNVVNFIKKKSMDNEPVNKQMYDQFLLLKIKGQKPCLFLSSNTQISNLDQIKLVNSQQQKHRKSFQNMFEPISPINSTNNNRQKKLKIMNKTVYQVISIKMNKSKQFQLKQQQRNLLQFPPNSTQINSNNNKNPSLNQSPQLKKKQSLPFNLEFNNLSQQLKMLKQKMSTYMKILQTKTSPNSSLPSSNRNISPLQFPKSKAQKQIQQKVNSILAKQIDLPSEQSRWKLQKQQYIDYIKNLQKQLHGMRNYQFSFTDKGEMTNQKNSPSPNKNKNYKADESDFKSPSLFSSQINQYNNNANANNNKFNINKSQLSVDDNSSTGGGYYKNQYHINTQRSRSKSKGSKSSKVIYLRR